MSFAFIKSTEGQDYVDPYYKENVKKAADTGIYFGAYHYFSFGTDGLEQAKNFTRTVSPEECFLPPVVDFELTDEDDSKKSYTLDQLEELLENLEAYYEVTPIIYTTPTAYFKYLAFSTKWKRYTLWMRNTYGEPFTKWSFWQYSDKGLIDGSYNGDEKYIDLNVYNGSMDDFIKEFSKQDS
jgi:lysozyme